MESAPAVSCAADPLDLRPALDALEAMIRARAATGRPLVVLMGEEHARPTHKALQQGILARLLGGSAARPSIAYGCELPHNILEMILRENNLPIPAEMNGVISACDADGTQALQAFRAFTPPNVPVTKRNQIEFCRRHNISVRFNDAALTKPWYTLDNKDPLTRRVMGERADDVVYGFQSDGVELRNRMMAVRGLQHMDDANASVYIQDCGLMHLFGCVKPSYEFSHSLCAYFAAAGMDVLPVLIKMGVDYEKEIPPESAAFMRHGLTIEGLSADTCKGLSAEEDFLAAINAHSGSELELYPYADPESDRPLFKNAMAEGARSVLRFKGIMPSAPA